MKRIAVFAVLLLLSCTFVFAEFQLEPSLGYFFNTDNYDGVKRSFGGLNTNISLRYFFTKYIGIFLSGDFKAWFSANNDEYVQQFQSAGMRASIDDDFGCKLDLIFGPAFSYPINDKFGLQGDIGLSATVWAKEAITGTVKYSGYTMDTGIFIDKISSIGFYSSIFGKYLLMKNGYITFGLRMDYKFTRKESGEVITAGVSQKYSDTNSFSGFAIAPFVGFMGSY
jgi:hypothetical protein